METIDYAIGTMPRPSKLALKLKPSAKDAFGERLARIRKERGFTQVELADKIGSIQAILSDYERGKSKPSSDMLAALALALEVSCDELLGIAKMPAKTKAPNKRILRRIQLIEKLPKRDQDALLRTIDAFLGKAS